MCEQRTTIEPAIFGPSLQRQTAWLRVSINCRFLRHWRRAFDAPSSGLMSGHLYGDSRMPEALDVNERMGVAVDRPVYGHAASEGSRCPANRALMRTADAGRGTLTYMRTDEHLSPGASVSTFEALAKLRPSTSSMRGRTVITESGGETTDNDSGITGLGYGFPLP